MQKVSIIIPTFNSMKHLQETLDSVLAQDYSHFECILVDDGSTDHTGQLVSNWINNDGRFQCYERPQQLPKGPSSCRNFGVGKASGDFLIFLDADDLLAPDCLKNRVKAFDEHPDCDFLVFQMERFVDNPDFSKKTRQIEKNNNRILHSFLQLHSEWPVTSPIYKARFFKKIGFNADLVVFEDLELAVKAMVLSGGFEVFENIDCYYRNDENYRAKYDSVEVKTKMVKGFQTLLPSLAILMKNNDERRFKNTYIRFSVVQSYKKLFVSVVLNNSKTFRDDNLKLLKSLSANGFLSPKEALLLRLVHQLALPFAAIKGSGVSRVIQFLYK